MRRPSTLRLALLSGSLAVLSVAGFAVSQMLPVPAHPSSAVTPRGLLSQSFDDSAPNAAQVRRGQYLVAAGDCISCHLREGGEPFAGGLALNTPFGLIYTSNITPDRDTGIGAWSARASFRPTRGGKGARGGDLYRGL